MSDGAPHRDAASIRFQTLVENIPGMVVYLDIVNLDDPSSSEPVYISPQVEHLLGSEARLVIRREGKEIELKLKVQAGL